jgi:hypothetical protein
LSRSRSWTINQAIERLIDYEEGFVQEGKNSFKEIEQDKMATDVIMQI